MKMVAVLIGPAGLGLVGLYVSLTGLLSQFAQLGIDQSGIRSVAEASASGDEQRVGEVVKTLRRICWFTGLAGWILTASLAWPLSHWVFGSPDKSWPIAILGSTLLIGAISGGQSAILTGMRRIGDLARVQVASAVLTTVLAIAIYGCLGPEGIVPVIVVTSAVSLSFTWFFSRRIEISSVPQSWLETARNSKGLVKLGAAFLYGALLAAIVGFTIRSLIIRDLGLEASGIFQAAWGLSGMFASFILAAMGTDFYPRLTAAAEDNEKVTQLVNEQIEIGALLALPGLLVTLAFAPALMHLFYTREFLVGADLLPWMVIGVLGQVISFPLGFVQRAKGNSRWILVSQTHLHILHLSLAVLMLRSYGIQAAAWAFAASTYVHTLVVFGIAKHLAGFSWSATTLRLTIAVTAIVAVAFLIQLLTNGAEAIAWGAVVALAGCVFSLRSVLSRLGREHRLSLIICRIAPLRKLLRI